MNKPTESQIKEVVDIFQPHGAPEIYLFGSLASDSAKEGANVDLAISGLPQRAFFRAIGEACEFLGKPIDVVDLDQETHFTRYLRAHGELVRVA